MMGWKLLLKHTDHGGNMAAQGWRKRQIQGAQMKNETKHILALVLPFIFGFIVSFLLMSFVNFSTDPSTWDKADRLFSVIVGWVIGAMLYFRINETCLTK